LTVREKPVEGRDKKRDRWRGIEREIMGTERAKET
jgi:hypothetical protein